MPFPESDLFSVKGPKPPRRYSARQEWLEARKKGIGGSDAGAVLGFSPWVTPLQLWTDKVGRTPVDGSQDEVQLWGTKIEPLIRAHFAEQENASVVDFELAIFQHDVHPWMLASIDGLALRLDRQEIGPGVLECKNVYMLKDEWTGGPPMHYYAQLQHCLAVTGCQWGAFAVLVGGHKYVSFHVPRNDEFIDRILIPAEQEFWERVVERRQPPAGWRDNSFIARAIPQTDSSDVFLDELGEELTLQHQRLKVAAKNVEAELDAVEVRLKELIGEHAEGVLPDGAKWTWKTNKAGQRTLRYSAAKE